MKICLRSIQLLLILVLIGFIGINPASSTKELGFPDPYYCYRPYETINSRLAELTDLYPDLARVKTIGQSFEGLPIQVLQLGREVETNTKPRLVLVSGLQANALAPVELNLLFAEHLLESYGEDANVSWLLEETEIQLIIVANPDGRLIAEQEALEGETPTWTKNKNAYDCTTETGGVALGLNFRHGWAAEITDPCAPNYPGPSKASEPETQAIETYLGQILELNAGMSLVIDLQNEGDRIITPFLYNPTAENPFENELLMLAKKLAYDNQAMPSQGMPDRILTGTLTDFAFGELQTPSLRFNLGPAQAGGDVTFCGYFEETLAPEGLDALTRAAILAAGPLSQAQGPEISFSTIGNNLFSTHIVGQADDMNSYKPPLEQDEYSAVHRVAFTLDSPPWQQDATLTLVDWSQPVSGTPYLMDFEQTFHFAELTPGKHTVYFQAWDTDPFGEAGQAGMINAVVINVPFYTYIPLLIR